MHTLFKFLAPYVRRSTGLRQIRNLGDFRLAGDFTRGQTPLASGPTGGEAQ
jgi:hypothetical protein